MTAKAKAKKKAAPTRAAPARPDYFNKLVYDVSEAADALGVSVPTVNRLIYTVPPQLRTMKIGHRRCVPVSAINEYIEQRLAVEAERYPNAGIAIISRKRGKSA